MSLKSMAKNHEYSGDKGNHILFQIMAFFASEFTCFNISVLSQLLMLKMQRFHFKTAKNLVLKKRGDI
jgi:hypothetical protein